MKSGNDRELVYLLCAVILILVISAILYFWIISDAQAAEITIEAEDMDLSECTHCKIESDSVLIQSQSRISTVVDIGSIRPVEIVVTAKGFIANNEWPVLDVMADDITVGSIIVDSSEWINYRLNHVLSGEQTIYLAFTNDFYEVVDGVVIDRDVAIDKITIIDLPVVPSDTSRIRVSWNPWDSADPESEEPEGYRIFVAHSPSGYDYSRPSPADGFPDGNITDGNSGDITVYTQSGALSKVYVVVRSYKGNKESVNSDEIETIIDKTGDVLPPKGLEVTIIE